MHKHLVTFAVFPLLNMAHCGGGCSELGSVKGLIVYSRQRVRAFEEGEGEDEEANTHDTQDDHTRDECTRHCVHLKHWRLEMGFSTKSTKTQSNVLLVYLFSVNAYIHA